MRKLRNVLFIMSDQLRWDYLSCYGRSPVPTPNIDRIAARGVRYQRAYCSSPVCGPSRMSFYTGRTAFSHGASWNFVPLPVDERTLGDYLKPTGARVALVGKTHMVPDLEGLKRLGVDPKTDLGVHLSQCGFEPYERDDGVHPPGKLNPDLGYNRYLNALGYAGANPWHDHANSALGADGSVLSGWSLRHARLPARVAEPHSETAYMTDRALQFIRETGDRPWVLHLSYIKPHWPLMAPAPYHALYGPDDVPAPVRSAAEREHAHPVVRAFMDMECSQTYSDDTMRAATVPTYMGLIRQLDDHIGRLLDELERSGRLDDTAIIFTSDHGDYLGDHWLGEKELFHDASARIPLLISDPDPSADATRGTTDARMVEAIDIVPTILDWMGIADPGQRIEGRSLAPSLRAAAETDPWRDAAFSEIDYAFYRSRLTLGVSPAAARAWMVRSERWKYVHYKGFAPQLFDLQEDPDELVDLGGSAGHAAVRAEMQSMLLDRLTDRRSRVALSDQVVADRTDGSTRAGVIIGQW
mgnify:CR=1 FL=1